MKSFLRICTAAITVFVVLLASLLARAADIECELKTGPVPEEQARKLWPSGVRPTAQTCEAGLLRGVISKGDFEKVLALYVQSHPFLHEFFLQSPGGDVDEAIKIGSLFRKYLILAVAPRQSHQNWFLSGVNPEFLYGINRDKTVFPICTGPDCICASACALIWFGAPERGGTVGLHRPYSEASAFKLLPPDEAAVTYTQMLDHVARYLEEMEVPRPIVDQFVSTGSGEIHWLEGDSSNDPPGVTEWKDASCGHVTNDEINTEERLIFKKKTSNLSANEQQLFNELELKVFEKINCEGILFNNARDKMAGPKSNLGSAAQ